MSLLIWFAILGCALARPSSENSVMKPVEVTVYYEALCGACRQFIPNQLLPTYTDKKYDYFRSMISKLTLVPFGWAEVVNSTAHEYECQHGPEECEGNKLHSCAIEHIPDLVTTLKYIACLDNQASDLNAMPLEYSTYPVEACQDELPADVYQKVINCYNSDEGWKLFERNGKLTTQFLPDDAFVPYIAFNNKRDDDLADAASANLRGVLCQVTGSDDPNCKSTSYLQEITNPKSYKP